MAKPQNARYGWKRDLPDPRDHVYSAPLLSMPVLPASADLRSACPPPYDQGQLGSCTANAISGAFQFDEMKQKLPAFQPSRLFIYYNERAIEHSIPNDGGAQIRDGMKSVAKQGVCSETTWPYDPSKFADTPTPGSYAEADKHRAVAYCRVAQALYQMKGCLASGYPFVFGFTVFSSFESDAVAKTGIVPMPGPKESSLGGHAVVAVGYDDAKQCFIVRNSWGPSWGDGGYCYMPYAYLTDPGLASDFWTIRTVNNN